MDLQDLGLAIMTTSSIFLTPLNGRHFLPNSRFNQMKNYWFENLEGSIFICLFVCFCRLQRWADTNVTLSFEDAQVIPSFSRVRTDDTDNTDDTDDIDDTDNTDDTDDIDDMDDTNDTDDTDDTHDTYDTNDTFLLLFLYFPATFLILFR